MKIALTQAAAIALVLLPIPSWATSKFIMTGPGIQLQMSPQQPNRAFPLWVWNYSPQNVLVDIGGAKTTTSTTSMILTMHQLVPGNYYSQLDINLGDGSRMTFSGIGVWHGSWPLTTALYEIRGFGAGSIDRGGVVTPLSLRIVPESGTWGMMLGGFGLMGASLRTTRRRQLAAV